VHDRQTSQTTRVRVSSAGSGHSISSDGRYVTFDSHADDLVDGDSNGAGDIFMHDRLPESVGHNLSGLLLLLIGD
jgi:hypothetical protein